MNTIKASEIEGDIPEGAWKVRVKSEPGIGVAGFYKKDKEVEGGLLFCYLGEDRWRKTATNESDIDDTLKIIYDTEFAPVVGMECEVFAADDVNFVGEVSSLVGLKVYVNAVFEKKNGIKMAAIEPASTNNGSSDVIVASCLRPIKSEEDKLRDWLKGQQPTTDRSDIKAKLNQYTYNLIKAGVKIPEGEQ